MSARKLLIAVFCLLTAPAIHAATFYVATTGQDGNSGTTLNAPWQTIRFAIAQLHPGDTLLIRGGTYTGSSNTIGQPYPGSLTTIVPSGTASNPITISAYPGNLAASTNPGPRPGAETVIIQPPDRYQGISLVIQESSPSYLIFEDIIVDGSAQAASSNGTGNLVYVAGGSSHNTFLHMEVKNGNSNGFQFSENNGDAPFNSILYCSIHDNGTDQSMGNSGYGLYNSSNDNLIEGNEFYRNHGYGIQNNGGSRIVYRKNKIHDNYPWNVTGGIGGTTGGGIAIMTQQGLGPADAVQFYDNLVYHNGFGEPGTAGVGVEVYAKSTNGRVYNNTIYDNNGAGIFLQYYDPSAPSILRNNIVFGNIEGDIVDCGDITVPAGPCGGSGAGFGHFISDHNLTTNPNFSNASATPPDFHLNAGSPAIGTGVNLFAQGVTTDFDGTPRSQSLPFDIGAYAFPVSGGLPPCDVNQSGSTDVVDVQLIANQAIGVAPCTADINQDGICNVSDVQRVVNNAIGGLCVSP